MGVSFRKSFHIGKLFSINISKDGGIGFSTGIKGMRISKNAKGIRFTLGKDGIYYTKWFTKKKKQNKNDKLKKIEENKKTKKNKAEDVEEEIKEIEINPETDYERIPTDDERALLIYLGSKERNFPLYAFLIALVGYGIYLIFNHNVMEYVIGAGLLALTIAYLGSGFSLYYYRMNRSIKLFEKDKYEKVYKILEKSLKARPKSKKAMMLMMFTSFTLEKYTVTLNYINNYKKMDDLLEVMYFMEGVASSQLGKYQEGIQAIEKVFSNDPDIQNSKYKVLGDCYLGLQDYKMAKSWFEQLPVKSKELNETIVSYKYGLGKTLLLLGDSKKALEQLVKVYDFSPDYKDVRVLINQAKESS